MGLKRGMRVVMKRVRRTERIDVRDVCRVVLLQMGGERGGCVGEVIGV